MTQPTGKPEWPRIATEMATRIRAHDWAATPLGPIDGWPQSLRTAVELMLDSQQPVYVAWGPALVSLYNDAFIGILGTKHPDALGQPFRAVWSELARHHHDDVAETLAGCARHFVDEPIRLEGRPGRPVGWFTYAWTPLRDETGAIAGFISTATETTDKVLAEREARHRSESALAASEGRYRMLFESIDQGFCVLQVIRDADGRAVDLRLLETNPSFEQHTGLADAAGKTLQELVPHIESFWPDLCGRVADTGEPVRCEDRSAALGRWFDLYAFRTGEPGADRVAILFSDITHRKEAELTLRDSELRFRTIANLLPQMIWSTLPDGYHDYYNRRWYEFTGVPEGSTDGDGWNGVFHPDDQPRAWARWRHSLATGEPYEIEYRLRHRSGEYRWVLGRAVPIRDGDGPITRWMGTCTDIHDHKLAQAALEASEEALREAARRNDEFLATLAHELRNPLAPIRSAALLLRRTEHADPQSRRASEVICRQIRHLTELVDDLMDVSRVTRGLVEVHRRTFDLRDTLAAALEQTASLVEMRRHRLTVGSGDAPLWVSGDPTRITQVIANLIGNAAKYTPDGGDIEVQAHARDGRVSVSVRDTGIGIAPDLLPHVFDLFTQAKHSPDRRLGGLGIGLALVRSITDLHGGEVHAHSDGPGQGSTFVLELPEVPAPGAEATPDAAGTAKPAAAQPLDIAIVDDNEDAAAMLAAVLELEGCHVTTFRTGEDLLESVESGLHADAFVLDIGLPGINGREVAERLRHLPATSDACLIALSGYGQPQDLEASARVGFDRHFVKPLDVPQLLDMLGHGPCSRPSLH